MTHEGHGKTCQENRPVDTIKVSKEFYWFYNQVSKDSVMDYKNEMRWKKALPNLDFPGDDGEEQIYWFHGRRISASDLGNINYGAVGAAMGIPLDVLLWQGGAAQLKDHKGYWLLTSELVSLVLRYYGDEEDDYLSIKEGYDLYLRGYFG